MKVISPEVYNNSVYKSPFKIRLKEYETQHNSKNILQSRPAGHLSPSGSERSGEINFTANPKLITGIAKEAIQGSDFSNVANWAQKTGGAKWFDSVLKSVNKNETFYEAITALVVAGMLKPLCVLAMPGAEKEDKQMSATKNAVSAGIGFIASNLILGPCSSAVNKIIKSFDSTNPTQYVKNADYVKALQGEELLTYTNKLGKSKALKSTLGDSFKTTYKKIGDLGVSPLKASITIALTPYVLKLIFGDKKNKNKTDDMPVMNWIKIQQNNKAKEQPANNNQISFGGNKINNSLNFTGNKVPEVIELIKETEPKKSVKELYCNTLAKPLAKLMGRAADTNVSKKLIQGVAKFEKPAARWSDLASIAITFFYVYNTAKSEKMEEERKLPLMINNVMVTAASSTAAFLIDKYTDKPMESLLRGYLKKHDADLYKNADSSIKTTLNNMLKRLEAGEEIPKFEIQRLLHHCDDLLPQGQQQITSVNFKDAVRALTNDETIKQAIKKNLISADDVAKMAASGYEKQVSSVFKNISKAKSLTVFTLTVRFLVTVLMTPVIGRVVALVNKKLGRQKSEDEKSEEEKTSTLGLKDFQSLTK